LTINTDYAPKHYYAVGPYNGDCLFSVWNNSFLFNCISWFKILFITWKQVIFPLYIELHYMHQLIWIFTHTNQLLFTVNQY